MTNKKKTPAEKPDKSSGKPSGAFYRRARKEREKAAAAADESKQLPRAVLKRIGRPPDEPTQVLAWANRALSELSYELLRAPGITLPERARQFRELAKAIGMVYPRAEIEELLRQLLAALQGRKETASGMEPLKPGQWRTAVPPAQGSG